MNDEPKSAYEIALEKLKRRDRERGEEAPLRLTDDQKAEIAEIRRVYEARLAEREILHRSEKAKAMGDPEALEALEKDYARDRRRIAEEREAKIAAARAATMGKGPAGGPPAGRKDGGKGASRKAGGKDGRRR